MTVNRTTFAFRSQQLIDWAIDGAMEVSDAGVFNRMHDAKTEFHYHLFKAEHKSFYNDQGLEILDECRTIANTATRTLYRRAAWWRLTSPRLTLERS